MIFITVGSQKFPFDRLLQAMDTLVGEKKVTEPVFAQTGTSHYVPAHFPSQAFMDRDAFREKMQACRILVTHGGTGAIVGALKAGKKVVAVPRLQKFGEHVDDHQLQLIAQFTESGLICSCEDTAQLGELLKEVDKMQFTPYVSNTQAYLDDISRYIDSL